MRPQPDSTVVNWIAAEPRSELFAASVTKAEILLGIASLPTGRRKAGFAEAAERLFPVMLAGRVIPFDADAAEHYAEVVISRRRVGRPIGIVDAQIAAIALTAGASIATRDVNGFEGCGVVVINPWNAV